MTQEPYTVSILVPVYGVEKYIERCARSIFGQTYKNLDIVFVDDCTPDKSIEILRRVLDDYPERKAQTRIIRHEHNRGLAAARNTAVAAATGTFLTHVDSDDWLEVNAVEEMVKKQVETGAEIVTGQALVNEGIKDDHYITPSYNNKHEVVINTITQQWHHEFWGRLIKSSIYKENNLKALEGVNQGEDWRMTPMLFYFAKDIARLDKTIYHYFMSDESMCRCDKIWKQNYKFLLEDYTNFRSLIDFFRDKNKEYFVDSKITSAFKCFTIIDHALDANDKRCFTKFRKEMIDSYSDIVKTSLGWKIALFLKLPYSYYLLKLYKKSMILFVHK